MLISIHFERFKMSNNNELLDIGFIQEKSIIFLKEKKLKLSLIVLASKVTQ